MSSKSVKSVSFSCFCGLSLVRDLEQKSPRDFGQKGPRDIGQFERSER